MAAGDTMQGRRRSDDTDPLDLMPGDYCVRIDGADGQRVAWVVTPNGHGPARLKGWDLTEHENGTITTSPSILAHASAHIDRNDERVELAEWHGYLERGVWREV